jgi:hypothetical protein
MSDWREVSGSPGSWPWRSATPHSDQIANRLQQGLLDFAERT